MFDQLKKVFSIKENFYSPAKEKAPEPKKEKASSNKKLLPIRTKKPEYVSRLNSIMERLEKTDAGKNLLETAKNQGFRLGMEAGIQVFGAGRAVRDRVRGEFLERLFGGRNPRRGHA